MRRGVFDVLRRGVDNTLVNWPLIAIRLGETVLFGLVAIAAVLTALLPVLVSIGIHVTDIATMDDTVEALLLLTQRWMLLVWILVIATLLLILFVAIHAFVVAGSARVYVDGERIAGPEVDAPRSRFHVFSMERWMAGGRAGWWTVFWIYNIAWGVAGLVLLLPLIPTMVMMFLLREQPPALVATGCVGLMAALLVLILVAVVAAMWTNRAIAWWAVYDGPAGDALAEGWRAIRRDFGRHVLVTIATIVVAMAGSTFFASFSMIASFSEAFGDGRALVGFTLPLRLAGSLFSSAFSAAVSSWYLACYSGLAAER